MGLHNMRYLHKHLKIAPKSVTHCPLRNYHTGVTELHTFVWEVRRGGSMRNCEWAVGDEPFPPFSHWAFSPFPRWMGV